MKTILFLFYLTPILIVFSQSNTLDSIESITLSDVTVSSFNLDNHLVYEHRGIKKKKKGTYLINKYFNVLYRIDIPSEFSGKSIKAFEVFLNKRKMCDSKSFYLVPVVYSSLNGKPSEKIEFSFKNIFIPKEYKGSVVFPASNDAWIPANNTIFFGFQYRSENPQIDNSYTIDYSTPFCESTVKLYPANDVLYNLNFDGPRPRIKSDHSLKTIRTNVYFSKD